MTENTPLNTQNTPLAETPTTTSKPASVTDTVATKKEEITTTMNDKKDEVKGTIEAKKQDFMSSLKQKLTTGNQDLKKTLSALPIDKQIVFFVGIGIICIALLILMTEFDSLLSFLLILIGGAMIYMGLSKPEVIQSLLGKKPSTETKDELK